MKVRINKKLLADMPPQVRELVEEWRGRWRKSFINVVNCDRFTPGEDAKVTVVNLLEGSQQTERVAGEFAGFTRLSPCDPVPLPAGCVAVATGFFCGHPWLTVYQSTQVVGAKLRLGGTTVRIAESTQQDAIEGRIV